MFNFNTKPQEYRNFQNNSESFRNCKIHRQTSNNERFDTIADSKTSLRIHPRLYENVVLLKNEGFLHSMVSARYVSQQKPQFTLCLCQQCGPRLLINRPCKYGQSHGLSPEVKYQALNFKMKKQSAVFDFKNYTILLPNIFELRFKQPFRCCGTMCRHYLFLRNELETSELNSTGSTT